MISLNFIEQHLNFLFSSSRSIKFLFNEILVLDLMDRFLNFNYLTFLSNQRLNIKFLISLPYSNSLLKFKNKVYLLLYLLVFEFLVSQTPRLVPIYKKGIIYKKKKLLSVSTEIESFIIFTEITREGFFNFLFFLRLYMSKNTYYKLTAPSRHVKIRTDCTTTLKHPRVFLLLNSGVSSVFDFFETFDEVIASKVKIIVSYKLRNNNFGLRVITYVLQSLNFNMAESSGLQNLSFTNVKRL